MNIEEFIKKVASTNSQHDKAYAKALREVYQTYNGQDRNSLLKLQESARIAYKIKGSTHHVMAACMVLNALLEETA